ncbi:MAG TPA: hypothetical protein VFA44_16575 [Gaiellaceae bacterium]|nr:hypothetical protein [Gaiellaceae bacterium]
MHADANVAASLLTLTSALVMVSAGVSLKRLRWHSRRRCRNCGHEADDCRCIR